MKKTKSDAANTVREILRMSQKAMGATLAMIGTGFVGGCIAICIKPDLAGPLSEYAQVFVPVFVAEIGMYGVGSTVEKLPIAAKKVETEESQNG